MTHINNYDYVKKWRLVNRDKYMEIQKVSSLKRYYYKQVVKEFYNMDATLFQ
jgi:hypothetical protein